MRVIDAVKETLADVSSEWEGLALETSAIVSFTASIALVNTQLIHHFVFRRADAVT